jgi:hypothetical protein
MLIINVLSLTACATTSTVSNRRPYVEPAKYTGTTLDDFGKYAAQLKKDLKQCRIENAQ